MEFLLREIPFACAIEQKATEKHWNELNLAVTSFGIAAFDSAAHNKSTGLIYAKQWILAHTA